MQGSDPGALINFALIGFIWLLPILIIISSNKTAGGEKLSMANSCDFRIMVRMGIVYVASTDQE